MHDFIYNAPTKVVFGKDSVAQVGALVKEQGAKKALLHYGGGSAERSGVLAKVRAALEAAGVAYVELGGVVPNPRLSLVRQGIELCRAEGVDFLLAVGGGSVIDSAKAIGYGLHDPERDVWELYEYTRKPTGCTPLGAVLTIAAAGSEMSNSCVITDDRTGTKRGCKSEFCRAKFAVLDPTLTMTLPDYQTQAGCTDIMLHTMERYFGSGGTMELTDAVAEGLLKTVMKNALILKQDPSNYAARAEIMWAGSLSHNGLTGCGSDGGDWACHGLEHELSGMFDVTHGAGLAAIWGSWARYVMDAIPQRFVKFARNVHGITEPEEAKAAMLGIEATEAFFAAIGMPTAIRGLGIDPTEEQVREMARRCVAAGGGKKGTAKTLYEEDCYQIYKAAL